MSKCNIEVMEVATSDKKIPVIGFPFPYLLNMNFIMGISQEFY